MKKYDKNPKRQTLFFGVCFILSNIAKNGKENY